MNILAIHTSHDGAITIVKNDKFLLHAQIERFTGMVVSSIPSFKLLVQIKKLGITFDKIIITFLTDSCHFWWEDALEKFKLISPHTQMHFAKDKNHHLFHSYCAKATIGERANMVVIDGSGSPLSDNKLEQETIFHKDKIIFQEHNHIGKDYEKRTIELIKRDFLGVRYCGKTMALSSYGGPLQIFQKKTEAKIKKIMPTSNVSYTGGVAQNVLANSQFFKYKNFEIDPLCTDQGISLGAVNFYMNGKLKLPHPVYLGFEPNYEFLHYPTFKDYDIVDASPEDICPLLRKEPVALFQGRSEQGQRGLGNRSLLIDGTNPKAIEIMNKIKHREWYRPFAPAVLEEEAPEDFEIKGASPYMLYVFKTKTKLPNISAVEGTARLQTVSKKDNINFYKLLKTFNEKYKIPFLLNTSLNLAGHTLVEDLNDLKYMLDYSPLKYAYLPDVGKLVIN